MPNKRDSEGRWIPRPKSFRDLLEDEVVKFWLNSYASEMTRNDYIRALNTVCKKLDLKPEELLASKEPRKLVLPVIQEYVQAEKFAMARIIKSAISSFFEANDKEIRFKRQDRVKKIRTKIQDEIVPNREQVYRMADATKRLRDKAIILCLFQSGVRVNCLLRWYLSLVKDQLFPVIKLPVRIKITRKLDSKMAGSGLDYYYAFLHEEAAKALRTYLETRSLLEDEDLIFTPVSKKAKNTHVQQARVLQIVKNAARDIGLNPKGVWTHLLRKSYRKVLNASDIDEDTKESIMGHVLPGSRGNYFDYHDIDEIAAKYIKAPFGRESTTAELETLRQEHEEVRKRLRKLEVLYGERVQIKEE